MTDSPSSHRREADTELIRSLAKDLVAYLQKVSDREHCLSDYAVAEFEGDIEMMLRSKALPHIPSGEMWSYLALNAVNPTYRDMCTYENTRWTIRELSDDPPDMPRFLDLQEEKND